MVCQNLNTYKNERKIAFFECKWQELDIRRSEDILADLKRKAELIKWHNDEHCELYGIIAKNIEEKEKLREDGYLVFDLEDL